MTDVGGRADRHEWRRWIPAAIVVLGLLAYGNSFSGAFLFDDYAAIVNNARIRQLWPAPWSNRLFGEFTFALNYAVGGLNPADYHAVNLAIHVLAGLALYGVVRRTLSGPRLAERIGGAAPWLSGAAALIWVAHPLQTESVTYVVQRYESLMGLLFLLTFYCFIRGRDSARPVAWYALSFGCCALGTVVKEIMAVGPVLVLLYDVLFFPEPAGQKLRRRGLVHAALFATWGVILYFRLRFVGQTLRPGVVAVPRAEAVPPLTYLLTQFQVITHYLRLAFFPHPLCLDYAWPPVTRVHQVILPGLLLAAAGAVTLWAIGRRRPAGFLGAWFFGILGATSSVIPVPDLAFEHRMYLPLAAICVGGVLAVYGAERHAAGGRLTPGWRRLNGWVLAVVLAALTTGTLLRNRDYQSEEAMFRDVLRKRPWNFRQHVALVSTLLADRKIAEAEREGTELVARLQGVLSESGGAATVATSAEYFYPIALSQLGRVRLAAGAAADALPCFEEALRRRPDKESNHLNLALARFLAGQSERALASLRTAVQLEPRYVKAWELMGYVLAERGRFADAIEAYRRTLALDPGRAFVELEMAWILAACPDGGLRDGVEALRLARTANRRFRYPSIRAHDVLAAAYAETGQFAEAAACSAEALAIARERRESPRAEPASGAVPAVRATERSDLVRELESRHRLYAEGKPFRIGAMGARNAAAGGERDATR